MIPMLLQRILVCLSFYDIINIKLQNFSLYVFFTGQFAVNAVITVINLLWTSWIESPVAVTCHYVLDTNRTYSLSTSFVQGWITRINQKSMEISVLGLPCQSLASWYYSFCAPSGTNKFNNSTNTTNNCSRTLYT